MCLESCCGWLFNPLYCVDTNSTYNPPVFIPSTRQRVVSVSDPFFRSGPVYGTHPLQSSRSPVYVDNGLHDTLRREPRHNDRMRPVPLRPNLSSRGRTVPGADAGRHVVHGQVARDRIKPYRELTRRAFPTRVSRW